MNVPFYRHQLTAAHAEAIARVVASPMLTSGAIGREVEGLLCNYFNVPYALLVNSWTNGALACLLAMDIKPGDEVIVPAMTFIATANMVELIGGKAVFVDVDPDTLLLTPAAVKAAVTPRTKAVMPVHLYGQMVDIKALRAAIGPGVRIIEDCAHCFEGTLNGDRPGAHSDIAIFSFYATKNVTTGEGGAMITKDAALAEKLKVTRLHGMSAGAIDRFRAGAYNHWDMLQLGVKANLPDLLAALIPPQMPEIEGKLAERERLARRYETAFAGNNLIRLPKAVSGSKHARHLFVIHVPPKLRDPLMLALNGAGVGCTVNYRNVPTLTYFREKYGFAPSSFPVAETWGAGTISLPLFPGLTDQEQDHVIATLRRELDRLSASS